MTCKGTNCTAAPENGYKHSSECLFDHARAVASGVESASFGVDLPDSVEYVMWRGQRIELTANLTPAGNGGAVDDAVNRFLGWPLPKDFAPDAGVSFTPSTIPHAWPVGTNLFTADQARAMFLHCLAPENDAWKKVIVDALVAAHIYKSEFENNPEKALNELLLYNFAGPDPILAPAAQQDGAASRCGVESAVYYEDGSVRPLQWEPSDLPAASQPVMTDGSWKGEQDDAGDDTWIAQVEAAARVVCERAGEDWDNVGDFAREILLDTQRAALLAAQEAARG